jgi:hypothetical protein
MSNSYDLKHWLREIRLESFEKTNSFSQENENQQRKKIYETEI